jgi:hypothetical protein
MKRSQPARAGFSVCGASCRQHLCSGLRRDRTNRSHEGCGEEWESGDVVWLGLRLDDQLDPGADLERLGEVALLAKCDDVVVKGLEVAV